MHPEKTLIKKRRNNEIRMLKYFVKQAEQALKKQAGLLNMSVGLRVQSFTTDPLRPEILQMLPTHEALVDAHRVFGHACNEAIWALEEHFNIVTEGE